MNNICSPLNYIGGKYKLLKQIVPLFPKDINVFVDLFCGGCNVGINVDANKIIFNDNLTYLIDLYTAFKSLSSKDVINHIESRIEKYELSLTNEQGYKEIRKLYNTERNPLDLFVLTAFSFNHQIRFNNSHEFNNPFGRERSSFNAKMKSNLIAFLDKIHNSNIQFNCGDFSKFDFSSLNENDFVYCDPPYLITTGTYNDGKRGFTGWQEKQEIQLLELLKLLDKKNINFALSNVIECKGKENMILKQWIEENNFHVNLLDKNYSNSNYHTLDRSKNTTIEVLVTNYKPTTQAQQQELDF